MISHCYKCKKSEKCTEPFPWDKCDKFEPKITNKYIIDLFRGMSPKMQQMIIEIMKVTQDGHNGTDKRGNE